MSVTALSKAHIVDPSRGSYRSIDKSISIKINALKSKPTGVNAKYSVKLKGSYKGALADEGQFAEAEEQAFPRFGQLYTDPFRLEQLKQLRLVFEIWTCRIAERKSRA